ncbi:amino acid adenylation domain-containing protein [Salinarimonas sp.]|uniref:amino acid adenylation domain-containing protein n=1 Tax=Salinarimonas sp. TaxID=2766526 RepID=UPI0032D913FE
MSSIGSESPGRAPTCVDWLRARARTRGDAAAFVDIDGEGMPAGALTWTEVEHGARRVAAWLRGRGVVPGDRVVLAFAAGAAFAPALFGCFYAGAVAVPCAPPLRARAGGRALGVLTASGAALALTTKALAEPLSRALAGEAGAPDCVAIEDVLAAEADNVEPLHRPRAEDVALLQYTSGSTSRPRGVAITHANIVANMTMLCDWSDADETAKFLSWLPLFHDMGLVVGYLMPLATGGTSHLITPAAFAKKPAVWLRAASAVRATHSAAPNFAFELCARQIPEAETEGLDLSSLHWVLNAAETIRRATNDAFLERYAPHGFDPGALLHYYGLAEATVCVTGHRPGRGPRYRALSGAALSQGRVVDAGPDDSDRRWIAAVGWTDALSAVAVVDPATGEPLGDDRIGEIWASGPSMAQGYWEDPEATAAIFGWRLPGDDREWFRTGDLGFARDSELYITGRLKEMIVSAGRNLYPVDIEATVQDVDPRLVRDRGAAFAIDGGRTEAVAIVQELRREGDLDVDALLRRAVGAVATAHEVEVAALVLIRQGTLPLTSSGKVQRAEARRRWQAGELKAIAEFRPPRPEAAPAASAEPRASAGEIVAVLCAELAEVLGLPADEIDPHEPLSHFGFGSLVAARLAERVGARFGLSVAPTQFYDTPTVAAAAAWIAEQGGKPVEAATPTTAADPRADDDAIAIVGMACRMPGAGDLEAFWSLLLAGGDGIGEPPAERRELIAQFAAAPGVPTRAGYLDGAALFDPGFFRLGKREADLLDPQHRLLLEATWHALEHAGIRPEDLRGRAVGAFVGISTSDYAELTASQDRAADAHFPTGNAHNMAANRLSYLFDWRGPSLGVDTACSSSLVAAHLAVQSLRRGESEAAVVGGVNLILSARLTRAFHAAGMLSADGRCKTFDAAADGYGRGEGCGVVVLKRLADARRDGDRVVAVIRGSALNQDGLSNGITAPNGPAQSAVIRAALADAKVAPDEIGYVETHGTGTDLGDPIELSALAEALGETERRPLLGALKSNIGHLEAAAGVAGLIKAALVVSRGAVPPNRNYVTPNPKIAAALARLEPATTHASWPVARSRRIAGVSSFGFGGANAHIVLEAPPATEPEAAEPAGREDSEVELLAISAGSEAGLRALAEDWRRAIGARPDVSAAVWAVNAARRRAALPWRLAVTGRTAAELERALAEWLAGRGAAASGRVPKQGPRRVGLAFLEARPGGPAERLSRMLDAAGLWRAFGLEPSAVAGRGVGAWAAAVIGGLTTPEEALRAVVEDGRGTAPSGETGAVAVPAGGRDPESALRRAGCDAVLAVTDDGDPMALAKAIGAAWIAGVGVDPKPGAAARRVPFADLPLMRYDRRPCWYDAPEEDSGGWLGAALGALGAAKAPIVSSAAALGALASLGAVRHVAPSGPPPRPEPDAIEAELTDLIAELLGHPASEIDPHERFVEMGADSIVLTRALRRIEERFAVKLTVRQLFETTPDIASLAAHLAGREAAGATAPSAPPSAPEAAPSAAAGAPDDLRVLLARTDETLRSLIAQQEELRRRLDGGPSPRALPIEAPPSRAPDSLPLWRPAAEPAGGAARSRALERLIPRYTEKTAGSKRLAAAFRPRLSDNRASAGFRFSTKEMVYPIVGERAKGAYLWDVDGNRYVDISMGFGAYLFGHAPDAVGAALREELERGFALGPQARLAGEVADLVCDLTGAERVAFATTGTEAVMTALRLARTVTGRRRIAVFEGAYHGHFDGVLASAGANGPEPMAPGVTDAMVADVVVLPYGEPAALDALRAVGPELAAILVEPVQSRRPGLQPAAFLRDLRAIADGCGAVLLFDEMITGFRIAAGGAQAHFGVRADLATYGKILGGGLPMGAVAGRAELLDALDGGRWAYGDASFPAAETTFFAGTYNKHPLAMAASRAMLGRIAELGEGLYSGLEARGADLASRLDRLFAEAGSEMRIARFGSLFRFTHGDNADAFLYALRARGVFVWEGRNCFLSTEHAAAEIDAIEAAVAGALEDARGGDTAPTARRPATAAPRDFPLSAAQRQLCLLAELRPGAERAYHESAVLDLPEAPDADLLERALRAVVARHEALRTVLDAAAGSQRVLDPVTAPGAFAHRRMSADENVERALAETVDEPFSRGAPAFRVRLLTRADGRALLVVVAHHAIADGRSLAILVEDLGAAYAALRSGAEPALPPASGFDAFLSRQTERRELRARNLDAWLAALRAPPVLDLPTDRPRPAVTDHAGASVAATLPSDLGQAVARVARALSATPVMVYLAAWLLLLHRASGQSALVTGLPTDGRLEEADATVVGDCAQMLPIASRLEPGDTLADFVVRLRGAMLDAYDRQDVDFAELLDRLALPADGSRTPLIAAAFNLDQADAVPDGFGAGAAVVQAPVTRVKFDLGLNLMRIGDRVDARLEYAADLFERGTAARWLDLYVAALSALVADPSRRPQDLALWQARRETAAARPGAATLPAWIEASAPADVVRRIEARARRLAARGIAAETAVGICVQASDALPELLLAVLRAGGCYVPLDPDQPARRLAAMAAAARCSLILCDDTTAETARRIGAPVLSLSALDADPEPSAALPPLPEPAQLAYVIHTSGSTGSPKSVGVPHAALADLLGAMAAAPGLGPRDRFLSVTPLGFDIAALELFLPLVRGAALRVLPAGLRADPAGLVAEIDAFGATAMQATPATWRMLLDHGWTPPAGFAVLCGGEALPPALARRLVAGGAQLWNLYGPTETTIWSMRARIADPDLVDLGAPIDGTAVYLVDAALDPVPDGAVGEVAIGGRGVARGYGGQPGLTADRFRPDPFSSTPGARMYLSGDLARVDADGRLRYLGRRDHQAKIRGHRIETGEVEAALERLDAVRAAAVLARPAADGSAELVAYLAPAPGRKPTVEELREALAEWLAPYMVPARFHLVEALPLNANGKVDRAALAALAAPQVARGAGFRAPVGATETEIAAVWRAVLGVSDIGAEDGFFELGGTSLALARMHDLLQRRLDRRFPLALCVSRPSIQALAAELDRRDAPTTVAAVAAAGERGQRRRAALRAATPIADDTEKNGARGR